MTVLVNILIWLHIVGFGLGMAGGVAMSQVGPRLAAAAPDQRGAWWPMAKAFSGMSGLGVAILLVTGPLVLWLKYSWGAGLGLPFMIKMGLLVLALIAFGVGKRGLGRLKRGDEGGARLMAMAGPLTGVLMLLVALAAVFTFA